MTSFLSKIQALTSARISRRESTLSLAALKLKAESIQSSRGDFYFEKSLQEKYPFIIAEVKKSSPSKGIINSHANPAMTAGEYHAAGASAVSVLTEPEYFGGSVDDFTQVRELNPTLPLLQKDFVIDPYQIYEAKMLGADCVLLIVALLGEKKLSSYLDLAQGLGLSALVEVHTREELMLAKSAGAKLIGINNRDLHSLKISLDVSRQLASYIPEGVIRISESGISSHEEIRELQSLGYQGFLVGSSLMQNASPGLALKHLLEGENCAG